MLIFLDLLLQSIHIHPIVNKKGLFLIIKAKSINYKLFIVGQQQSTIVQAWKNQQTIKYAFAKIGSMRNNFTR